MNGLRCYELYICTNLHFKGNYDAFKYNFKTRVNVKSFEKRRDKYFFSKFASKYPKEEDFVNFVVANTLAGVKWIGEFNEDNYTTWKSRQESLSYSFSQDLALISETFCTLSDAFSTKGSSLPVVDMYHRKEITLETLCIFERFIKFIELKDSDISDTILWPETRLLIQKYEPFIKFTREKFKILMTKNLRHEN